MADIAGSAPFTRADVSRYDAASAKALGITVPPTLLACPDGMIE
jgi:hypothetical protein